MPLTLCGPDFRNNIQPPFGNVPPCLNSWKIGIIRYFPFQMSLASIRSEPEACVSDSVGDHRTHPITHLYAPVRCHCKWFWAYKVDNGRHSLGGTTWGDCHCRRCQGWSRWSVLMGGHRKYPASLWIQEKWNYPTSLSLHTRSELYNLRYCSKKMGYLGTNSYYCVLSLHGWYFLYM